MITDVLLYVVSGLLAIVNFLFSGLSIVIPSQIQAAFLKFFSYVSYGNGIFPFTDAIAAIQLVLFAWMLMYAIKIYLFGFSAIPWLGKVLVLPTHTTTSSSVSFDRNGMPKGSSVSRSSSSKGLEFRNPFQKKRS